MAVKPPGSYMTIVDSGSATAYLEDIQSSFSVEEFSRMENSNKVHMTAPTLTGAEPQFTRNIANEPIQLLYGCSSDVPRSSAPDDANVDAIKRRFEKVVFNVTSAVGPAAVVDQIQVWAAEHSRRLSKFRLHIEKAQMGLSVTELEAMRLEDFDYLLVTGTDVYSNTLISTDFTTGWVEDILITEFKQGIEYAIPNSSGGRDLYKAFSMTFEKRINVAQSFTN